MNEQTMKNGGTSDNLNSLVMCHFNDFMEKDDVVFHVFDEDDIATQVVTYNDMVVLMHEIAEIISTPNDNHEAEEPKEKR